MSEKKIDSSFCWKATIKPDVSPEKTEVRWYRRDKEGKQSQVYGNDGSSRDELSEEAKERWAESTALYLEGSTRRSGAKPSSEM